MNNTRKNGIDLPITDTTGRRSQRGSYELKLEKGDHGGQRRMMLRMGENGTWPNLAVLKGQDQEFACPPSVSGTEKREVQKD